MNTGATTVFADQQLLDRVVGITEEAAREVLSIYREREGVEFTVKSDNSPVTEADFAANACLLRGLSAIDPDLPILTEESVLPAYGERQHWSRYWLIDPLDGTKEFIDRNGEFTINVALIDKGRPILGVVNAPIVGSIYTGLPCEPLAHCIERGIARVIRVRSVVDRLQQNMPVEIVSSRRHQADVVEALCCQLKNDWGEVNKKAIGSSLKLCLVAAGEADLYPRFGPTSEWDTGAAQAVLEAAGGSVLDDKFQCLAYNQKESILNPTFFAVGGDSHLWRDKLVTFLS